MIQASAIQPWLAIPAARAPSRDPLTGALAFIGTMSGMPQIWLLEDGGPRQITDHPEPVNGFAWSPKGCAILFTADCGGDERWQLHLLDPVTGAVRALTEDPMTVHLWGAWSPDGSRVAVAANIAAKDALELRVIALADGATRSLGEGLGHQEVLGFSPEGEALLVRRLSGASSDGVLELVSLAEGGRRDLLPSKHAVKIGQARLLKAGGGLAICDLDGERMALWHFDAAGGEPRCLLAEAEVDAFALGPSQETAVVALNVDGYSRLLHLDLSSGVLRPIALPLPGVVSGMSLPGRGETLLCAITSAVQPSALYEIELTSGAAKCLYAGEVPERLPPRQAPYLQRFASFDGEEIPYFLYPPSGPRPPEGWPSIFIIHGGPEAQWRPDWRADVQWMVSQGIQVVAPNVRGSTGYGRRFHALDDREKRLDALADVTALRAELLGQGLVDPSRCGIFGRSYGGWMVLAAVTEHPEDWTMAANFYGIANFFTHLMATGPWARQIRAAEYGDPTRDAALLTRISPIFRAERIAAPLFMTHADRDPRVPPGESENVNSVLFGLGKACEFHRIAHAGHGFLRLDQSRRVFGALAQFIAKEL